MDNTKSLFMLHMEFQQWIKNMHGFTAKNYLSKNRISATKKTRKCIWNKHENWKILLILLTNTNLTFQFKLCVAELPHWKHEKNRPWECVHYIWMCVCITTRTNSSSSSTDVRFEQNRVNETQSRKERKRLKRIYIRIHNHSDRELQYSRLDVKTAE